MWGGLGYNKAGMSQRVTDEAIFLLALFFCTLAYSSILPL